MGGDSRVAGGLKPIILLIDFGSLLVVTKSKDCLFRKINILNKQNLYQELDKRNLYE